MKLKKLLILLFSSSTLLCSNIQAESLKMKPGLWETTITQINTFTGSTTNTETKCITKEDAEFDPQEMMKDLQGCSVINNNIVGNSMTINMSCNMDGMKATLTGKIKSEGDHGEGQMNMSMQMPGMNMSIDLRWLAKRVGDC